MIFVLRFRFRQRRAVVDAPVHRLQTFIDIPFIQKIDKCTGDDSLIAGAHGQVRVVPTSENAQADKIALLQVDVLFGVLSASRADLCGGHGGLLGPQLPVHFDLDWQAVAVPSWNVGGVKPLHSLHFDNKIFQ